MSLALWLVVFLGFSYLIGRLYEVTIGWKSVGYAFYPAMLVAALGRLLACLLSKESPNSIDLMRGRGPSQRGADKLPGGWWFRFLYAILPFALSLAAFVLAWTLLDDPIAFKRTLPRLPMEIAGAIEEGTAATGEALGGFLGAMGDQRLGDWQLWACLYLGFALVIAPAPSRDDLISVAGFSGAVGLVVFVLTLAGVDVVASRVYRGEFWEAFTCLFALALFVLLITVVVLLPLKFFLRSKED